jgi:hypothetical protein
MHDKNITQKDSDCDRAAFTYDILHGGNMWAEYISSLGKKMILYV